VMLVERSTLVRSGLRRVLEDDADIAVVSEAGNGRDALEALTRHDVDVLVICSTVDREACRASAIAALRPTGDLGIICVNHWTNAVEVGAVLSAGRSWMR
jgi:DNA-binding NarL/FixJ family response regulator